MLRLAVAAALLQGCRGFNASPHPRHALTIREADYQYSERGRGGCATREHPLHLVEGFAVVGAREVATDSRGIFVVDEVARQLPRGPGTLAQPAATRDARRRSSMGLACVDGLRADFPFSEVARAAVICNKNADKRCGELQFFATAIRDKYRDHVLSCI